MFSSRPILCRHVRVYGALMYNYWRNTPGVNSLVLFVKRKLRLDKKWKTRIFVDLNYVVNDQLVQAHSLIIYPSIFSHDQTRIIERLVQLLYMVPGMSIKIDLPCSFMNTKCDTIEGSMCFLAVVKKSWTNREKRHISWYHNFWRNTK